MPLPQSGEISIDNIRVELGFSSQTNFSLRDAENGTYATLNPASINLPNPEDTSTLSEWYGYNHRSIFVSQSLVVNLAGTTTWGSKIDYNNTLLSSTSNTIQLSSFSSTTQTFKSDGTTQAVTVHAFTTNQTQNSWSVTIAYNNVTIYSTSGGSGEFVNYNPGTIVVSNQGLLRTTIN